MNHYVTKHLAAKAVTFDPDREGAFTAQIAVLDVPDHDGDILRREAIPPDATVMVVPTHDWSHIPMGAARLTIEGDRVLAVGELNLDLTAGREWRSALLFDLAHGGLQEWSYGFFLQDARDIAVDGVVRREMLKIDPVEVSPVLRGAGVRTGTVAVKGMADPTPPPSDTTPPAAEEDAKGSAVPTREVPFVTEALDTMRYYAQYWRTRSGRHGAP